MKKRVVCPLCGQRYPGAEQATGSAKCGKCGYVFRIDSSGTLGEPPGEEGGEATTKCPFCGEAILAEAKKCRFCGEWLTGLPRAGVQPSGASEVKRGIMMEKKRAELRQGGRIWAIMLGAGAALALWKFTDNWKLAVAVGVGVAVAVGAAVEHSYWKGLRDDQ